MKKRKEAELDFIVDRLTDSIRNTISGDSFETTLSNLDYSDLKQVSQKKGWNFDWKKELSDTSLEVYKLSITSSPTIIQGVISLLPESDHIYMNLLESAPFNIGRSKLYEGVAGNLAAHACRLSFQRGFDGFVVFTAKPSLSLTTKKHWKHSI